MSRVWPYHHDSLTLRLRELLLLEGISLQGLGNWQAIAEHVGTRTREEVEKHYNSVYIDSPDWPLPVCFSCFRMYHSAAYTML